MHAILFILTGAAAVAASLLVVTRRNPVSSVLFLIAAFLCQAVLFLLLGAEFLAAIQVIVYTGAIMVLFVLVLMLLDLRGAQSWEKLGSPRLIAGFGVAGLILVVAVGALNRGKSLTAPLDPAMGSAASIGEALFTRFILPFEALSLLLLAAIVGVVAMFKKERVEAKPNDQPAAEGGEA